MAIFTYPCGRVVVNIRNIETPPRRLIVIFIEGHTIIFPCLCVWVINCCTRGCVLVRMCPSQAVDGYSNPVQARISLMHSATFFSNKQLFINTTKESLFCDELLQYQKKGNIRNSTAMKHSPGICYFLQSFFFSWHFILINFFSTK